VDVDHLSVSTSAHGAHAADVVTYRGDPIDPVLLESDRPDAFSGAGHRYASELGVGRIQVFDPGRIGCREGELSDAQMLLTPVGKLSFVRSLGPGPLTALRRRSCVGC
jgi:hypothetical protein